ncbi:hypothetical protein TNCT_4981 [Trichonephila clavata]|uniref:Uncharacterized protein n=1 Tax=Trichonephila clavata TaxID=2740835 RepID=A0A8X6HSS9_TRICU|nr:hypothetical protein TNCT_4981 [Trichonephila clavata]
MSFKSKKDFLPGGRYGDPLATIETRNERSQECLRVETWSKQKPAQKWEQFLKLAVPPTTSAFRKQLVLFSWDFRLAKGAIIDYRVIINKFFFLDGNGGADRDRFSVTQSNGFAFVVVWPSMLLQDPSPCMVKRSIVLVIDVADNYF